MSQRPPASRPGSRSSADGQRITLPPVQVRDDPQRERQLERQEQERGESRGYPPIQSSPQRRVPSGGPPSDDWRSAPSRSLGLDAMLNPTEPEGTPASGRRISSGTTDSNISAFGPQSYYAPSPTTGSSYTFPSQPQVANISPIQQDVPRGGFSRGRRTSPRRILTPTTRNPQNRDSSVGKAPATIDAQREPFLPSRGRQYTSGLGPETPPISASQSQAQHYGFPPMSSTSGLERQASMAAVHGTRRESPSQSASPSMSSASANPSSQTSPAAFLYKGGPPPTSGTYFPGQSFAVSAVQAVGGGGLQFQAATASGTEGPYSAPPPSSAAASTSGAQQPSDPIQVLTITTSQGIYNVPVDVHQASRLADEKRARNAGASARFRQRRKEKEKEASTTIEKMQQTTRELERKVRDVEAERDFYRGERDRFREVIYRTPDMRHLVMQAPTSPQSTRSGSYQGGIGSTPGGHPSMGYQGQEPAQERASRRRRTDASGEFTSVAYALPPSSTLAPVLAPGFPTQGPTNLPPIRLELTSAPQTSQASIAPASSAPPPPFDPYARGSYDRSWPGEGRR